MTPEKKRIIISKVRYHIIWAVTNGVIDDHHLARTSVVIVIECTCGCCLFVQLGHRGELDT